jgi:formyl-CoA transferase
MVTLYYAFYGSNRRSVTLDLETEEGKAQLRRLALASDVVVDTGKLTVAGIEASELIAEQPSLVVVAVTSFGTDGPWATNWTTDLVSGAFGGARRLRAVVRAQG